MSPTLKNVPRERFEAVGDVAVPQKVPGGAGVGS